MTLVERLRKQAIGELCGRSSGLRTLVRYDLGMTGNRDDEEGGCGGARETAASCAGWMEPLFLMMKAKIEAARGICLSTAVAADLAHAAADEETRAAAKLREELLTPIAKAWSTDVGVEVASLGVQIHGGMGFIEETGAAQHYRDARITPIYEGTNGIQAIDLIGRKLGLADGQAVADLMDDIRDTIEALKAADASLTPVAGRLEAALNAAASATAWLVERRARAMPDALSGATAYLKLLGDTVGGWMLAKGALAPEAEALRGQLLRVYAESVLAQVPGQLAAVTLGDADLVAVTPEALGVH